MNARIGVKGDLVIFHRNIQRVALRIRDRFPSVAALCQIRFGQGRVVVLRRPQRPVADSHTTGKLPNVAAKIMYTAGRVVVRPSSRAAAGQRFVAVLNDNALFLVVTVPVGTIRVSVWQGAQFQAGVSQQAPLRRRQAVPTLALGETRLREILHRDIRDRLLQGQAVRLAVNHGVFVDGNINFVVHLAADDERRVYRVTAAEKLLVGHAAEPVHDGGNTGVVVDRHHIMLHARRGLLPAAQLLVVAQDFPLDLLRRVAQIIGTSAVFGAALRVLLHIAQKGGGLPAHKLALALGGHAKTKVVAQNLCHFLYLLSPTVT